MFFPSESVYTHMHSRIHTHMYMHLDSCTWNSQRLPAGNKCLLFFLLVQLNTFFFHWLLNVASREFSCLDRVWVLIYLTWLWVFLCFRLKLSTEQKAAEYPGKTSFESFWRCQGGLIELGLLLFACTEVNFSLHGWKSLIFCCFFCFLLTLTDGSSAENGLITAPG